MDWQRATDKPLGAEIQPKYYFSQPLQLLAPNKQPPLPPPLPPRNVRSSSLVGTCGLAWLGA